jgi:ubiquinone/menaquinone biosynthesis C-methylase UbiE
MTGYEAFAPFYDAVQGDGSEHAAYLRELIEQHQPAARTVLELACGTGSILEQLQPSFEVTGLDLSESMLAVAAEKVPGVRLVEADMTRFDLHETYFICQK